MYNNRTSRDAKISKPKPCFSKNKKKMKPSANGVLFA